MRNKLGNLCMSLGAVLMLAALSLCIMNERENNAAGIQADTVAQKLEEEIQKSERSKDLVSQTMKEVEIDGYLYIGILDIPSCDLSLPVMSEWDYNRLKIAPCRYSGGTKTGDLVIAAHNYKRHFGKLKNLSQGDCVYFTDMEGIVGEYVVAEVEVLLPTAVEDMSAGDYDLTLFTCTYGGSSRITIRCERVMERGGSNRGNET